MKISLIMLLALLATPAWAETAPAFAIDPQGHNVLVLINPDTGSIDGIRHVRLLSR